MLLLCLSLNRTIFGRRVGVVREVVVHSNQI